MDCLEASQIGHSHVYSHLHAYTILQMSYEYTPDETQPSGGFMDIRVHVP